MDHEGPKSNEPSVAYRHHDWLGRAILRWDWFGKTGWSGRKSARARKGRAMTRIPDSMVIALWITASFWAITLVAHLVGGPPDLVFPLFPFGILTGTAAWSLGSKER